MSCAANYWQTLLVEALLFSVFYSVLSWCYNVLWGSTIDLQRLSAQLKLLQTKVQIELERNTDQKNNIEKLQATIQSWGKIPTMVEEEEEEEKEEREEDHSSDAESPPASPQPETSRNQEADQMRITRRRKMPSAQTVPTV